MINNSIILSFVFTLLQKLKVLYDNSLTANFVKNFVKRARLWVHGSSLWNFIKRKDFFSRTWTHSAAFTLIDGVINVPSKLLGKLYNKVEGVCSESIAFKLLKAVLNKFEVLAGISLAMIPVVSHNDWNNLYSFGIALFLALMYFIKSVTFKYEFFNTKALDFPLVMFILLVVFSAVASISPGESIRFLVFYLTCFLIVLVMVSSIKTAKGLGTFIEILLVGIAIAGLYGIWQAINGVPVDPSLTDVNLNEGVFGRIYSTMDNPNNFAEVLIMIMPFFGAAILNAGTVKKKIVYAILFLFPAIALVLTLSRSAWIAFAFAVFIFMAFKNKKLIPVVIILGILSVPFLPRSILIRIKSIWNPNDSSALYRLKIYNTVWPMFKDFWVSGLGTGTDVFMKMVQRYYQFTTKTPVHTHNLYLQIWMEAGVAAFISFVWFIARTIKKCFINVFEKADTHVNNILIAGASSIAGIMVMGMAEYVWYYPRVMVTFWIVIGIVLSGLSILAIRKEGLVADR